MARKDGKPGRLAQIRQTYQMTKQSDPRIGWILLGCILAPVALAVLASLLLKNWWLVPLGFTTGLLIAAIVLGRRAERAARRIGAIDDVRAAIQRERGFLRIDDAGEKSGHGGGHRSNGRPVQHRRPTCAGRACVGRACAGRAVG